jgi:hypothetical protein
MPSTHSLPVTTATSAQQLQDFLNNARDESSIHGKTRKDGSFVLYVSKGRGTGFKQALFPKKFEARRLAARQAILDITRASPQQNTALYTSIKSGFTRKEHDGNFVPGVAPLTVGKLKSVLSEQIELHQQTFAEGYFKGIELDFDTGKARTPFSPQNESSTPLANGLRDAMEGIIGAADQLSGYDREKLEGKTMDYIQQNLPYCPFDLNYAYPQIIDFSLNFDRSINKLLEEIFDGISNDKEIEKATIKLADNFAKLEFSADLFADREFINSCPKAMHKDILELGKQLGALRELVNQPNGFHTSIRALTGLAINSPADFRNYLNKFKSNSIHVNLPNDAIIDEN